MAAVRITTIATATALAFALGCDSDDISDDEPGASDEPLIIDVGPFDLAPGEETSTVCFSHSLGNTETMYVSRVSMEADYGFHHSNWLFVPDHVFSGPDGVWECGDRDFDTALGAAMGGVLFAQSTQATTEVQEFQPGAVIPIPPGSKLVANIHLLNASTEPLAAETQLEIATVDESEVEVRLAPIYLQYTPLTIPPQQRSRFTTECDLAEVHERELGRPVDLQIHYILPHYHGLGDGIRLALTGGDREGDVIFENDSPIGEPLGRRLEQPFDTTGATGLRFSCDFTNPTDEEVGWGIGDQEMCIVFGFAETELMWGGGVMSPGTHQFLGATDGVAEYGGDCTMFVNRLF